MQKRKTSIGSLVSLRWELGTGKERDRVSPRKKKANHLDATNLRMRTAMRVDPQDS